jgi:phenylpyruvate tautomerase PptA (4-oxalocrotonate tautomerase family)
MSMMPTLVLHTSTEVPQDKKAVVLRGASRAVADGLGKPESYVMVALQRTDMVFGGKSLFSTKRNLH